MKRSIIHVFALASAIFAGGVALADSGYRTGHHEFRAQSAGSNSGVMTKSSVGHNGAFLDGKVNPNDADAHPRNMQRRDMRAGRDREYSPLPPNAGNDR
ncbi:hypothetical protein [Pelagivirga sediminicola]|uniref:hypothetical protein n=1 Tax=Pelagivirga sediminicola TaxID=2170575 RepID=UPI00105750E1|nr:hypothetical protein [Pelagivirga sediminicola]